MTRILGRATIAGGASQIAEGLGGQGDAPTPPPPPAPEDSALLWVTADQGITGTGADVDTWATRSTSGASLVEAGTGKPQDLGTLVDMDNAAAQINYFQAAGLDMRAVTETGVFTLAWRGVIDSYDGATLGIDLSLIHTRGATGRGFNLFVSGARQNLSIVTWDGTGTITHRVDWTGWGAAYTLGTLVDIVVVGDGATMRMSVDGVSVGSDTIVTDPGPHAVVPLFGRLVNSVTGAYHIGKVQGVLFDDTAAYSLADARALVTLPYTYSTVQAAQAAAPGLPAGSTVRVSWPADSVTAAGHVDAVVQASGALDPPLLDYAGGIPWPALGATLTNDAGQVIPINAEGYPEVDNSTILVYSQVGIDGTFEGLLDYEVDVTADIATATAVNLAPSLFGLVAQCGADKLFIFAVTDLAGNMYQGWSRPLAGSGIVIVDGQTYFAGGRTVRMFYADQSPPPGPAAQPPAKVGFDSIDPAVPLTNPSYVWRSVAGDWTVGNGPSAALAFYLQPGSAVGAGTIRFDRLRIRAAVATLT